MAPGARPRVREFGEAEGPSAPLPSKVAQLTGLRTATRRFPLRVTLARDPARILVWLGIRLVVGEIGLIVGLNTPGNIGTAVAIAGAAVLAYVALLALHVLSLRLEIHPGEVHVASALTRRRYPMRQGPVTRMRIQPRRGFFGTQLGGFGLELGDGRGPADEAIDVVRLSPVASMIVIPSTSTRLAVAPASDNKLLRALRAGAEGIGLDTTRLDGHSPMA